MKKKVYKENRNLKVEIKGMRFGAENGVKKKGVRASWRCRIGRERKESGEDNDDEVKEGTIEEKKETEGSKKKVRGKSVKNQYYQIWRGEKKKEKEKSSEKINV